MRSIRRFFVVSCLICLVACAASAVPRPVTATDVLDPLTKNRLSSVTIVWNLKGPDGSTGIAVSSGVAVNPHAILTSSIQTNPGVSIESVGVMRLKPDESVEMVPARISAIGSKIDVIVIETKDALPF